MNNIYCAAENWIPTVGDSFALGWLITMLYFGATLVGALALRVTPENSSVERTRYIQFWCLTIILLTILGLNKQLDFHTLFKGLAKCIAIQGGWYQERFGMQKSSVVAAIVVGPVLLLGIAVYFKRVFHLVGLAISGVALVVAFTLLRAISFNHADEFLGTHLLGMRMDGILELPGILLVAFNAIWLVSTRTRTTM